MKSKFFLIVLIVIGTSAVLNAAQAFGPCLTYNSCTSCCGNCNTNDCPCGYPIACYNGNSPTGSFCCSYSDGCGCASCGDCEYCCLEGCYCNYGHTWFSQRDQGTNQCEVISFTFDKRHKFGDEFYGDFAITLGYQQNFNRYRLSSYFFNKNGLVVNFPSQSFRKIFGRYLFAFCLRHQIWAFPVHLPEPLGCALNIMILFSTLIFLWPGTI